MKTKALLLLVLSACSLEAQTQNDWYRNSFAWRRTPPLNGVLPLKVPHRAFPFTTKDGRQGWSSPSLLLRTSQKKKVIIGQNRGRTVFSIRVKDGKTLWEQPSHLRLSNCHEGKVASTYRDRVCLMDVQTGNIEWESYISELSEAWSATNPILTDEFFITAKVRSSEKEYDGVFIVDRRDGSLIRKIKVDELIHGLISVQGNLLYLLTVPSTKEWKTPYQTLWHYVHISCYNLQEGKRVWRSHSPSLNNPVVHNKVCYFNQSWYTCGSLDAHSGKVMVPTVFGEKAAEAKAHEVGMVALSPSLVTDDLFVIDTGRGMNAFDLETNSPCWESVHSPKMVKTYSALENFCSDEEGKLYLIRCTGELYCVDSATGQLLWEDRLPGLASCLFDTYIVDGYLVASNVCLKLDS